jgi:Protein of unknown function (DUF3455)
MTTKRPRLSRFVAACAGVLALAAVAAAAASACVAQTAPGDPLDPRTYAPESKPFLVASAVGVQKYACQPNGTWLFTDPEATLYKADHPRKPIGTHFLNFATGRPVWQFKDGSAVEAARKVSVAAPAGNIPWLLLQTAATTSGFDGDRLVKTTWVQRLNTSGGAAPTTPCTPAETLAVPYTADYFFWKAKGEAEDESDG